MIRVWDPLVRVFHWSLVLGFAIAWISAEDLVGLHRYSGYFVGILVAIRVLWGLAGPQYARFSQFVRGPRAVMDYLKSMLAGREKRYVGHNPAGGAMVVVMVLTLIVTSATGWLTTLPQYRHWGLLKEGHDAVASLTMILIVMHVSGVVLASLRHKENLARAMVTGEKRAPEKNDVT